MTISSTVRLQLTSSQVETPQASQLSLASNADYKARISSVYGKLYELDTEDDEAFQTINLTNDEDLLGNALGFSVVYGLHIENKSSSSVYLDSAASSLDWLKGDIELPSQGCIALHSVYGLPVSIGADVLVVNPNGIGSFTIRIVGA